MQIIAVFILVLFSQNSMAVGNVLPAQTITAPISGYVTQWSNTPVYTTQTESCIASTAALNAAYATPIYFLDSANPYDFIYCHIFLPGSSGYSGYLANIYVLSAAGCPAASILNGSNQCVSNSCPVNSQKNVTPPTACICDPNYQPDSTGKSCVTISACPIDDLSTDPNDPNGLKALSKQFNETPEQVQLTQNLEGGMNGYSLLSDKTQKGEQCLANLIGSELSQTDLGYKVTATVRTLAYQAHLRAVWDKFFELQRKIKKKPAIRQMCLSLIAQVEGEIGFRLDQNPARKNKRCTAPGRNHCIRSIPADPNKDPKHTDKLAFDISETTIRKYANILLPPRTMATEASACNLTWGGTFMPIDVVHFLCCVK